MSDRFDGLPTEKKKRIIDVCIEEFSLNGYEKASTNTIVKKADISKGILFHYFGNKKNLFLYIFDYAINYLVNKYYAVKVTQPNDLFERLVWISTIKMKMVYEEPLLCRLAFDAFLNMPEDLKPDLMEKYAAYYTQLMPPVLEGIDMSRFRSGIDPQKAIETILLCLDGLSQNYLKMYKNKPAEEIISLMEDIMEEYTAHLEILKYGVYGVSK